MGCIRETPPIKKRNQYGRCKRNFPERKKKKERKKERKKAEEGSTGSRRESPCLKINTARDVSEKLPT